MIAYLKGTVIERGPDSLVVEVGGIGYEVFLTPSALRRAGPEGSPAELFISESTAMYGGGVTLYGFLGLEEKELFLSIRDHVPSTGAKKALEYLDKASRSLPDFHRAVLEGDERVLADAFGFTRKTAERLVAALKDELGPPRGDASGARAQTGSRSWAATGSRAMQQTLDALLALGYKPAESRQALESVAGNLHGKEAPVEELVRLALRQL